MANFENQIMVGARGGGYGLDAELARKREAQYDYTAEQQAREWIEAITGGPLGGDASISFGEALKDGVTLCKLINEIKPGMVKSINSSKMPFKQMENTSNFLKACRALGVAEHSLFETVDLFELKDIGLVVQCLFALGSTIQTQHPEFEGPHLGAKMHTANKRNFTDEQKAKGRADGAITKQNAGSSQVMERLPVSKPGICFGAENAGVGDSSVNVQWSQGSHGIMERKEITRTGITMGAEYSGIGDCSSVPQSSMGSKGIMERKEITRTGITMGAEYSGIGDCSSVPQSSMGSKGIMERQEITRTGITMGAEYTGIGDVGCVPQSSMGSKGIMERQEITRTGITMGADYSGIGDVGAVPKSSLGSSAVMERSEVSVSNDNTFGAHAGKGS